MGMCGMTHLQVPAGHKGHSRHLPLGRADHMNTALPGAHRPCPSGRAPRGSHNRNLVTGRVLQRREPPSAPDHPGGCADPRGTPVLSKTPKATVLPQPERCQSPAQARACLTRAERQRQQPLPSENMEEPQRSHGCGLRPLKAHGLERSVRAETQASPEEGGRRSLNTCRASVLPSRTFPKRPCSLT